MDSFKDDYANFLKENFVGFRLGIVKDVFEHEVSHNDPEVHMFGCKTCDTSNVLGQKAPQIAGGADSSRDIAYIKTIGEAIERYCAAFIDKKDIVTSSYSKLKGKKLSPEEIELFDDLQYNTLPFIKFTKDTITNWVECEEISSKEKVYVPAFLVYLPYTTKSHQTFCPTYSTGLSFSSSKEKAILGGIYEVLERDAYTIFWLNKVPCNRIKITDVNIKKKFKFDTIQHYVFELLTEFNIPTIATFSFGKQNNSKPLISVGLGTSINRNKAILKSLLECAMGRPFIRNKLKERNFQKYKLDYSDILDFEDMAAYYSLMEEKLEDLNWLFNNTKEIEISNLDTQEMGISEELDKVISNIKNRGFKILIKNLTTPDLIKFDNVCVYRVIINGLVNIYANIHTPFLGQKRIYKAKEIFPEAEKNIVDSRQLNIKPHLLG